MGASIKTVPDVGRGQQAGRWGNAAFLPLHCLSLLVRHIVPSSSSIARSRLAPSLTRSELHVNISFFLSMRNGIRHDSCYHRTSEDAA